MHRRVHFKQCTLLHHKWDLRRHLLYRSLLDYQQESALYSISLLMPLLKTELSQSMLAIFGKCIVPLLWCPGLEIRLDFEEKVYNVHVHQVHTNMILGVFYRVLSTSHHNPENNQVPIPPTPKKHHLPFIKRHTYTFPPTQTQFCKNVFLAKTSSKRHTPPQCTTIRQQSWPIDQYTGTATSRHRLPRVKRP